MDDQEVSYWSYWVGAAALVLVLAAVAWLFVSMSTGTTDGNVQVRVSDQQVAGTRPAHHRSPGHARRCIDAAAGRGVSGCMAESSAATAASQPSERRRHRSTRPAAVEVNAVANQGSTASALATVTPTTPPSTPPPSTTPPSTPPASAPARAPLPHNGPVPGGNTSPPHTGPRP